MAIKPLDARVDQMLMDQQKPGPEIDPRQLELDGLPSADSSAPLDFEPVQVAGLGKSFVAGGKKIAGAVEGAVKKIEGVITPADMENTGIDRKVDRPLIHPEDKTDQVGPYQVIREAEEQEVAGIMAAQPEMPGGVTPSPTAKQIESGVVKGPINTNNVTGDVELKQFIEAVGEKYGVGKTSTMSFTDIVDKLSKPEFVLSYKGHEIGRFSDELEAKNALVKEGLERQLADTTFNNDQLSLVQDMAYSESDLAKMIDPQVQTVADPKELYKLMLAVNDAGSAAFNLGKQVMAARSNGTLTPELAMNFKQAVSVEGALLKSLKRRQVDVARSLGIFKMAREGSAERGAMMEQVLNSAGGIESVHDLAKHYVALDSRAARRNLSAQTLGGSLKDIWMSTWINGLLSSFPTHVKNVTGNAAFAAWQIPEMYLTTGVGKIRNMVSGGDKAMQLAEANSRAFGFLQGMADGWVIAGKAFVKNEPTDAFTKIESVRAGSDAFDIDFGDSNAGLAVNKAVRAWGSFVTLPGRALMAEDEFFKAIGYRMELNGLASRAKFERYEALMKQGDLSPEDAMAEASALKNSILQDPPKDIDDAAKAAARSVTFTRELEKGFQLIEQARNVPGGTGLLLRLLMPFVKTPTNIALEGLARTPLFAASPRFWASWNKGGIERDKAIARVTLGSTASVTAGYFTLQGKLTGAGPFRLDDKRAMEGTGHQDFSFVFDNEDLSPELLAKYKEITKVTVGPNKTYVSYAGMEPLSTLLAMGATTGEYAMAAPDDEYSEIVQKGLLGAGVSMYEYIGDQPMMQGMSDVVKIFQSQKEDAPGLMFDLMSKLVKVGGNFVIGGSPVGAYSSFVGATNRVLYPERVGTRPQEMLQRDDLTGGAWSAWMTEVNRTAGRHPFFKYELDKRGQSLTKSLDPLTGEVETISAGNMYEFYSPFKTKDGKMPNGYEILVKFGIPKYDPPRTVQGIIISQAQTNRWIELATGSKLGDVNQKTGKKETLTESLQRIAEQEDVLKMWNTPVSGKGRAQVQSLLQSIITKRYSDAKQVMINGSKKFGEEADTELRDAIEAVARKQSIKGKY